MMAHFGLAWRFALREMRGGISGFRIFLACLGLGVAAIAGAGSLNTAIQRGIEADAQALLGGDLQARLTYRTATAEELQALNALGQTGYLIEMRSMARAEDLTTGEVIDRTLIELKGADAAYPLYGDLELSPEMPDAEALAYRDGLWGAVVDPNLLGRLKIDVGDMIRVGEAYLEVRATIEHEPDRVATFATFGPRVLVAEGAMAETQLLQEGSLIRHIYNVRLDPGVTYEDAKAALEDQFPDAGWRIRGLEQAAQGLESFLDNVTLFLTLVGLTALLVGGIGVANAVRAYLESRVTTIAALKCLGAPADLVFTMYLIQVGILAVGGTALGLVAGSLLPPVAEYAIGDLLPVEARFGVYLMPMIHAAVFGILTAFCFALWPLALARDVPAVALFRKMLAVPGTWPRKRYLTALVILGSLLCAYTVLSADRPQFAFFFVVGSVIAMVLFRLASILVKAVAKRLSQKRSGVVSGRPSLRLALANLYRPGAATTSVVLSLGLGLSVLVAVVLLEANLQNQINERLPKDAPRYFFLDIQKDQVDQFRTALEDVEGVTNVQMASMIRGRIVKVNGTDVADLQIDPEAQWAFRGDRGLTYSATAPENAVIDQGEWWPENYTGENLLSVDSEIAAGAGLTIGDTVTVNILGREITGRIANTRSIEWQSAQMNFTFVFSPNALENAPGTFIATVAAEDGFDRQIEDAVTDPMPNVTAISVAEAIESVNGILSATGAAVRLTAAVALIAGALVLAGAIAAGHARRVYESVVLKVLGGTRLDVLKAFVFEYSMLGLATGAVSVGVGALAAWSIITFIMQGSWMFFPGVAVAVTLSCIAVTLLAGFAGIWRALGVKAAPLLRND